AAQVAPHPRRRRRREPDELLLTAAATTSGRGEVDLGAVVVETMTDVGLTGTHVVDATGDPRALDAHPQLTGVEIGFDREGASVLTELVQHGQGTSHRLRAHRAREVDGAVVRLQPGHDLFAHRT